MVNRRAGLVAAGFCVLGCAPVRNPDVCCTNVEDCATLGLSADQVDEFSHCEDGFTCVELACVPSADAAGVDAATDATEDAPPGGRCRPDAPFETLDLVPNISGADEEVGFAMTGDELTAFMAVDNGTLIRLYTSNRDMADQDFPAPTTDPKLAAIVAGTGTETHLYPAASGLVLYFMRQGQLNVATRGSTEQAFTAGTPVMVGGAPLPSNAFRQISTDGQTLYSIDSSNNRLYAATRTGGADVFGASSLASNIAMLSPIVSSDEATAFYVPASGGDDIFSTTRASTDVPFDAGTVVAGLGAAQFESPLFVTEDGCLLYMSNDATGSGNHDIWVGRRGF